jgi:hypothetical protein
MSSKKKVTKKVPAKAPAPRAPRAPRTPPTPNGLSKKAKADITRFVRDVAAEYHEKYSRATVFRLRRAVHAAPTLRDQIIELGGRAWMREGFRDDLVDLIEKLPDTAFRQRMTPAERAERNETRRAALVNDAKGYGLAPDSVAALRRAYAQGLRKDARRNALADFDQLIS